MTPFTTHTGIAAVLNRANVDTDQIIPKQFLKRVERTGFGQYLFFDWRFLADGSPNPEFELNQPAVQGATILIAGRNFGSGSSREHAPWALQDYGFRTVIAPSFADIFFNNCFQNGMLPIRLAEEDVSEIMERANSTPGYQLTVDLVNTVVSDANGLSLHFDVDPFRQHCLLNGLDDIGLTLQNERAIDSFELSRPTWKPAVTV
jgi:3-isopropylmalate/(R)-2-methylmalate dehydratase small subunit